jgi:N-methylhydantoinase A/oxoprolinase/acetone carboxylase beta subunit
VERLRTVLVDSESSEVVEMAGAIGHETAQHFIDIHGERPGEMELLVDVRYESQSHELSIPYRDKEVRADFLAEHRTRFGFDLEDSAVEVVNIRGVAYGEAPIAWDAVGFEPGSTPERIQGPMWMGADETLVDVWLRTSLPAGFEIDGPAVIVDGTASVLAEPDDRVRVLDDGVLEITQWLSM